MNLVRNWYLPISAVIFFGLATDGTMGYRIGIPIALIIIIISASRIPSVWKMIQQQSIVVIILCVFSAIGICIANRDFFYLLSLEYELPKILNENFRLTSLIGIMFSCFFVFFCLILFWKEMKRIIGEICITDKTNWKENIIYILLVIVTLIFMVYVFMRTQVFYGTEHSFDIIYTSDSPCLVKGKVYWALMNAENDLRQPLFALFAAPFVGIPYLIAHLIGASASVQAILVNGVQVFLLFSANFMLAKMLKLDRVKRVCFMVLTSCTYTQLLNVLMMEQYVVAYFWLIFCIYLIADKKHPDCFVLYGAGGTLLPSMILLPFVSSRSPIKEFKAWFIDMIKYGVGFVGVMLTFCRFDVFYNLVSAITDFSEYTGKTVTITDKIYQYTEFVRYCIIAPNASVSTTSTSYISWKLNTPTEVNWVGVLILGLIVVSVILNREKKSTLLAAAWVGFSVVMLVVLGWGTQENGLILYSLYFGWAFFVLLFQLLEKIVEKISVRFLLPVVTVIATFFFLATNVPAITEMLEFAIMYYPN